MWFYVCDYVCAPYHLKICLHLDGQSTRGTSIWHVSPLGMSFWPGTCLTTSKWYTLVKSCKGPNALTCSFIGKSRQRITPMLGAVLAKSLIGEWSHRFGCMDLRLALRLAWPERPKYVLNMPQPSTHLTCSNSTLKTTFSKCLSWIAACGDQHKLSPSDVERNRTGAISEGWTADRGRWRNAGGKMQTAATEIRKFALSWLGWLGWPGWRGWLGPD